MKKKTNYWCIRANIFRDVNNLHVWLTQGISPSEFCLHSALTRTIIGWVSTGRKVKDRQKKEHGMLVIRLLITEQTNILNYARKRMVLTNCTPERDVKQQLWVLLVDSTTQVSELFSRNWGCMWQKVEDQFYWIIHSSSTARLE